MEQLALDELEVKRRRTRRKMAWVCVGLLSFVTLLMFGAPASLNSTADISFDLKAFFA